MSAIEKLAEEWDARNAEEARLLEQEEMAFQAQFGAWFRANMDRVGSVKKWADIFYVSPQAVRNWMAGSNMPGEYRLFQMMKLLGATPDDIMGFKVEDKRRQLRVVGGS